jgi:predicted DNA-binding transcriptional regulator AlpA
MSIKKQFTKIPSELEDVALIDGPACAAAAGCGLTRWRDLVRRGEAPQPVIRKIRFTRWRLAEVRVWLEAVSIDDPAVMSRAYKASHAAQRKRQEMPQTSVIS